eukprot:CAMPEP_0113888304 /NCGR_PEP_ID=MMETSP0780_2-20120614/12771_1 /TAXON_ID=652834 /ORGANISM="Palpitomonas bilix" /LENGTH=425 /DNA_ID=CAMNT_0000877085 /DNA_START=197 /DNA_END=1470 /DNA_ORIENTATION=+ /assembly_acc=CAM_ASM_000599
MIRTAAFAQRSALLTGWRQMPLAASAVAMRLRSVDQQQVLGGGQRSFSSTPSNWAKDLASIGEDAEKMDVPKMPLDDFTHEYLGSIDFLSPLVGSFESLFNGLHELGLPWLGVFSASAVLVRIGFFPFTYWVQRNAMKFGIMEPIYRQRSTEITTTTKNPFYAIYRIMKTRWQLQNIVGHTSLLFPLSMAIQFPVFVSAIVATRVLATYDADGLKDGGMLWFPDLTAADPYMILPMASCIFNAINLEVAMSKSPYGSAAERTKIFLQMLSLGLAPIIAGFPAASFVYTITSGVYTLAYTNIIRTDKVRDLLRLKPTKEQMDAFYLHPSISQGVSKELQKEAEAVNEIMRNQMGKKVDEALRKEVQDEVNDMLKEGKIGSPILVGIDEKEGISRLVFTLHKVDGKEGKGKKRKSKKGRLIDTTQVV